MSIDGDDRFETLVERYGALIASAVARVARGSSPALREDIQQKVRVSLWKRLKGEQTIDHPASYIYRAAVRETVQALREERARGEEALPDDVEARRVAPDDPFSALAGKERLAQIEAAIDALLPERRRAVRLHLAGFDVSEIMRLEGWTYQKARNLVSRGMADLREALADRGIRG